MPDFPSTTTRRQVFGGVTAGLVLPCVLAACGQSSPGGSPAPSGAGSSTPPPSANPSTPSGPLAALADLPVGGGKLVDGVGGRKVLLVRTSDTEVKGYDPTCPHAGATVQPPTGSTIKCPLHGSTFDAASGSVTGGPAKTGLKTVAVKVEKDQVLLA
ncbi:Rieske (2Fe-2S) protein [Allokutzneria oryzae]|uniref:Rieske (2Fe-2S) protein n=1 Tax=Allokutzneria oryzae TaxID=1378989 RepID=A0ABV5ZX74_9PSEU